MKAAWLLASTLLAGAAAAEPSKEAVAFGTREGVEDISISPDGGRIVLIRPAGARGSVVQVIGLGDEGGSKTVMSASGNPEQVRSCRWSSNTRVVCQVTTSADSGLARLGFSRMFAVNADGSDLRMLTQRDNLRSIGIRQDGGDIIDWSGGEASVLMTRQHLPEESTGTHLAATAKGLGVDRVDTVTGKRVVVERPGEQAVEYISDGAGAVRIKGARMMRGDYAGDAIVYAYRTKSSRDWKPLSQLSLASGDGFNPYAVDAAADVAYGFDDAGGRKALYRVSLDGSLKKEVVLSRPDVDVDGLVRIGRSRRVVGASWATERREFAFFDPELAKLSAALGRALPTKPLVRFVDATADEKQLVTFVGSDDDPGRYYLYTKATRRLEELLPARAIPDGVALSKMTPVTYTASDGTAIPAYLTLPAGRPGKGLPAIVMPHGGPGARDEWGFDWLVQFFASRGYAVLQPNFRGSTGYGDAWFQKNGFQSWRTAIGDVVDAGRWLRSQGIAAPDKLAIVGWSYGGYAALQASAIDADLFKAIVAVAPVTDLDRTREEARNFLNFRNVDTFIGHGPHVSQGSPARSPARIIAPVLLFHGDIDTNVGIGQSRLMRDRLAGAGKKVELIEYKGLDHQLDDTTARIDLLDRSDNFLRAALKL